MNKYYKTLEERDIYYRDFEVQKKIATQCKYREVIFIKYIPKKITIRPFKIFKPEHFQRHYDRLSLNNTKFDIYISNASVKLPKLPSDMKGLKAARMRLKTVWEDLITGYDFFVDFDANSESDEPELIKWAQTVKQELKNMGHECIELWATGSGGIHLVEKGRFEPDYIKKTVINICNKHNIPLRSKVDDPPYIDDGIYDLRRIRRVGWSIHNKTGRVMTKIVN